MTPKTKNVSTYRWGDGWIALLAMVLILIVALRLWATEWTEDLYILVYLAFFAGLAGLLLGYSRLSGILSILFSTIYGIFIAGWLLGTTVENSVPWRERILNYIGWRLRIAIEQFMAGKTLDDPILFLTILALILWILGGFASFIIIRKGYVWLALIPLGLCLLIIGQYEPDLARNTRYLVCFLFSSLLLIGRMTFLRNRQTWLGEGIQTTTETQSDFNKTLILLTILLLVITWILPVTAQQTRRYSELWQKIKEPWDRFYDRLTNIFTVENGRETTLPGFFSENMALGIGSLANEAPVFSVKMAGEGLPGYRPYWRARSYDYYTEGDWSTSAGFDDQMLFPDNFAINFAEEEGEQPASLTFTIDVSRMINLYTAGKPTWVSRPVTAITQRYSQAQEDLIALIADPEITQGETYQVETLVNLPTESTLRSTSVDYPDWLSRYLQLPKEFSPEIIQLAQEITTDLDNPYDKARAITRYLRINIEYSRTIPVIPADVDPLEWFLFEHKSGFCNFYATAQVMMLRALGIPARIAVGFAQGEYDSQTRTYIVRQLDSHAWPEVYFMDYGWVIFEPTVSQPALILPAGHGLQDDTENQLSSDNLPIMDDLIEQPENLPEEESAAPQASVETPTRRFDSTLIIWTMFSLFIIGLAVTILILTKPESFKLKITPLPVWLENTLVKRGKNVPGWLHRWSVITQMSPAEKAYRQLGQALKVMGQAINLAETPSERAQTLTRVLPEASAYAQDIIWEFNLDQYSNHITSEERAKKAIRQVRWMALKARVRNFLR